MLFVLQIFPGGAQEAPQPPPPAQPPPAAQARDEVNSGGGFSIEPFYWLTSANPDLRSGSGFTANVPGALNYPGKGSTLRISGFEVRGAGTSTTAQELNLFTTDLAQGDLLATSYSIKSAKVSWDYLTYPFQIGRSDFRLKTLWEVQYTTIKSKIASPNDVNASATTPVTAMGSRQVVFPTLGLGLENTVSRHFRWEAKGSGFALPHRADIWDAEATLAFRVGQFEILGGEKAYHFKTSPKNAQYVAATLSGAYAGLRWYWK
jgi:hypothetical protein